MKQAHIGQQGQVRDVLIDGRDQVRLNDGTVLRKGESRWLPPASGTLFALGLNYADHASRLEFKSPTEPLVFIKAPNTFIGHQQQSVCPNNVEYMHYETELVVVIRKTTCHVNEAGTMDCVAGYTVCNDYTIHDYLESYCRPNLRIKSRDTLASISPWVIAKEAIPDPHSLILRAWVNGEPRQQGTTADLIFSIPSLITYLSEFTTLQPGDMIATGMPKELFDVVSDGEMVIEVEGADRPINHITSQQTYEEIPS